MRKTVWALVLLVFSLWLCCLSYSERNTPPEPPHIEHDDTAAKLLERANAALERLRTDDSAEARKEYEEALKAWQDATKRR